MPKHHAYWLAALIDGEGSIVIRKRVGHSRLFVCISIAQNDRRLLERAQEYAGCGVIYGGQGPRKTGHQLQIYRQADTKRLLKEIGPLLVLKREKALAALDTLP